MGVNDAAEQLEVAKQEMVKLERENAELRRDLDAGFAESDHLSAKYYQRMRAAEKEMQSRELHHFEAEQALEKAEAVMLAIADATSGRGDGPSDIEMVRDVCKAFEMPTVKAAQAKWDTLAARAERAEAVIAEALGGLNELDLDSGSVTAPGTARGSILRDARTTLATYQNGADQ